MAPLDAGGTAPPLWPAGHLPHKGGDQMSSRPSQISGVEERAPRLKLPISPLAGEMPGRAEGGVKELDGSVSAPSIDR
ncbi:hypothetical protein CK219_18330 [Mesorhizobium sp. WSM4313]|nr:hypothetical protein CK219_18330 [Mesorhizobium sp. WSM4313]